MSPSRAGNPKESAKAGQNVRARRLRLGLTLGDVQRASLSLARELGNPAFILPASRLQQIEARDFVPSIHRLYTLSRVYKCRLRELLSWYGIPPH
jgi:transcriptional regulator with XRE-family HTH domain